eukprot:gene6670-4779_t
MAHATPASDNWGLLSVADLINTDAEPASEKKVGVSWTIAEHTFPLYCGGSAQIAASFANQLATTLKHEGNRRSGTPEKFSTPLRTSKHIQQRISTIIDFFSSSVKIHDTKNSGFETVSLLSAAMEDVDRNTYFDLFIRSIEALDWSEASTESCLEVLKALHDHLDDSQCTKEQQLLLNRWRMTLSLYSGSLSAVVRCLLLPSSASELSAPYTPPTRRCGIDRTSSSIDSFFLRHHLLPFSVESVRISCFPGQNGLTISCGASLHRLKSLGMMGTRLEKESEYNLGLQKGEIVLWADNSVAIVTRLLKHEDCRFMQSFREVTVSSGEEQRQGVVVINCSTIETRNTKVTFAVYNNEVFCLVSSMPSNTAKRKLSVISHIKLTDIFDARHEDLLVSLDPSVDVLLRNPVSSDHLNALYFTKKASVSVGRVTLKANHSPFCIEMWVYPRNSTEAQTIFSVGKKRVEELLLEIEPKGDGIEWRGGWRHPQRHSSFTSYVSPGKLGFFERWWHVALNFTGKTWELWLDDRFVSCSQALVSPDPIRDEKLNLGKSFVGFLAEVRIWGTSRSAAELYRDAHRRLYASEPSLLACFPLNEGHGDLLTDCSKSGEHGLLSEGAAGWFNVPSMPVAHGEDTCIPDFLPLCHCGDGSPLFFAVTQNYYCVAVSALRGPAATLYQYDKMNHSLASEMRVDLLGHYWESLLCWAIAKDNVKRVTLWDIHDHNFLAFTTRESYSSIWNCGRDVLSHAAKYAEKFIHSERYLADQSSWTTKLPELAIDSNADLIPLLVAFIKKAVKAEDQELAKSACVLLHANLFFRYEVNPSKFFKDVGERFFSMSELMEAVAHNNTYASVRDEIIRIAVMPVFEETQLLQICCQCLLSVKAQIMFLNAMSGKNRTGPEEKLFLCLLDNYSALKVYTRVLEDPERSQILYCALIREASFHVDRCLTEDGSVALQRTCHALEVFQESLFAKVVDAAAPTLEITNLSIHYAKTVLHACEKTVAAVAKAMRKFPDAQEPLLKCLERSHVHSLLPSVSLSLPSLPVAVLASCFPAVQVCRTSISALGEGTRNVRWISSVGVALTFSLALMGRSLLQVGDDVAAEKEAEPPYLDLLRGGKRKAGTERDVLIKNLQQGLGPIGKCFDELQKKDGSALRVVRDEKLRSMERNVMAAFCALLIPTKDLRDATPENLEPAFRSVVHLRPWVLAKRQESKSYVAQVEARAVFLSQFECCCTGRVDAPAPRPSKARDGAALKWKRFFRAWKLLRQQKMLLTAQESSGTSGLSSMVMDFLQKETSCSEAEAVIAERTRRAKLRVSGFVLLKQLQEEARVTPALAKIVLPVFAKALYAWHYTEGVECCSADQMGHLHAEFFGFFESALRKYLTEKEENRHPWALLLCSLFSADMRAMDFRNMKPEIGEAFRLLWATPSPTGAAGYCREANSGGGVPSRWREASLSQEQAGACLTIGASGRTVRAMGGSGTCVAPCTWRASEVSVAHYFEVHVVDLLPGSQCSIGVGPQYYTLSRLPGWRDGPPSYALHNVRGVLTPSGNEGRFSFGMGDVVGCGWNVNEARDVYWTRNGTYLVETAAAQAEEELTPLIGLAGTGLLRLNFGKEPFLYNGPKRYPWDGAGPAPVDIRHDAWDAFRAFSIRAALCLRRSAAAAEATEKGPHPLSACVAHCFNALSAELSEGQTGRSGAELRSLVNHLSTLAQLLQTTPREVVAPCVAPLALTLERVAGAFLSSPQATSEAICELLTAWFHCMNLSPPADPAASELPPNAFLGTLIRLAGRLFATPANLAESQSPYFSALVSLRHGAEEVSSLALALLQRINGCRPGPGPAGTTDADAGPRAAADHAWSLSLHHWVLRTLRACSGAPTTEALVALGVLGGVPRHAAPGDSVVVRLSVSTTVTLISASLAEELCEVVDSEGKCRTYPLRLCGLIHSEGESNYFPAADSALHGEQAQAVLDLALRVWRAAPPGQGDGAGPPEGTALCDPQLLAILWRCSMRGVVKLPTSLLGTLFALSAGASGELGGMSIEQLRTEKVVVDWRCAAALQAAYDQGGLLGTTPLLDPELGGGDRESGPEARPRPGTAPHHGPEQLLGAPPPDSRDGAFRRRSFARGERGLPFRSFSVRNSRDELGDVELPRHDGFVLLPQPGGEHGGGRRESAQLAYPDEELESDEEETEESEEGDEESIDSDGLRMEYMDDMDLEPSGSEGGDGDEAFPRGEGEGEEAESIHFERGCLRLSSPHAVGNKFTIEMCVRPVSLRRDQVLVIQEILSPDEGRDGIVYLMARLRSSSVEFGVIECSGGRLSCSEASDEWLCKSAPLEEDLSGFTRLTFVQLGSSLSLYAGGALQDTKRVPFSGSLLQKDLFLGGAPDDDSMGFVGDMKGVLVYESALEPSMVEQLHTIDSSFAALVDSRLCIKLRVRRKRFQNAWRGASAVPVEITPQGDVGYLESSTTEVRHEAALCAQELDFSYDTEERDPYTIGQMHAVSQDGNAVLALRRLDGLSAQSLLSTRRKRSRLLTEYYSVAMLWQALHSSEAFAKIPPRLRLKTATSAPRLLLPPALTGWEAAAPLKAVAAQEDGLRRIIDYAVLSGCDHLYTLLDQTLQKAVYALTAPQGPLAGTGTDLTQLVGDALGHLLDLAQRVQVVRVHESAHPYRASTRATHGVVVPDQRYYMLFFDARCASRETYFTFASDQNMANELAQLPGFALSPFAVPLQRFFFSVHSYCAEPQWGYKVFVVYGCRPQLLAMRVFRSALTTFLERTQQLTSLPFVTSRECLQQLASCANTNTGKTRRLALSCLTDLLLHAELFPQSPPAFASIHDIRRMTERRYRKYLSNQRVHSRFLQVVAECCIAYGDARYCWSDDASKSKSLERGADTHAISREEFLRQRQQQRANYAEREGDERVKVYKVQEVEHLQVEWSSDRICVTRSDVSGGAIIAATPLRQGVWYYELRVGGPGEIYIGVLPSTSAPHPYGEGLLDPFRKPIAYNGRGVRYGRPAEHLPMSSSSSAPQWGYKDYVGVVLSIPDQSCSIYVNGEPSSMRFSFANDDSLGPVSERSGLSFFPYFAFEGAETFYFNFGGAHFEFEPPRGCLPLDPINHMLGTVIPYNQLRAFQDLAAHLLTAGRHPMPPFCHEEPDPFAGSTERSGPAHVSIHPVEGIQVSGLEVKNVGTQFGTVTADCTVSGGAWYFEVTLRSQGLMQIGWAVKNELHDGSIGDMPSSWSIDLFRQLKWYNGKSEPLTVPRRWNVGDVIGCAIDLNARELTFFFNGRKIPSGGPTFRYLPVGAEYTPGISLRAGNHVNFNFGSSAFQYKPDGFQALGVRDSWCERMDTYYTNEPATATLRRQRVMRDLWREGSPLRDAAQEALRPSRMVVRAVDAFCQESGKHYSQITEELLRTYLTKQDAPAAVVQSAWEQFSVLNALARVCLVAIPFLCLNTQHRTATTQLFLYMRAALFLHVRGSLVMAMLRETNIKMEQRTTLYINRRTARNPAGNPRNTVFGQTLSLVADRHPRMFQSSDRIWVTVFLGEGAEDGGGPFREHICTMCSELMSSALPLFVPTANNTLNTGTCREAFVPAAGATTPYDLLAMTFVGRLMGFAMRGEEPLSLFFPPLVWKYMCQYPITEDDVGDVDSICMQCIEEFRKVPEQGVAAEDFAEIFDAEFVTRLSDNTLKELLPGGQHIKVTLGRCREYADLLLEARLHEFDLQLHYMREGLLSVVPEMSTLLFTPTDLEQKVCGRLDYKVEDLRKTTIYDSVGPEQRRIQFFWKALEEATALQRRLFLRFVSGRDRLPIRLQISALNIAGDPDEMLPQAATCFFTLKLPDYSSLEIMKQKLYYSIENCADMDNDMLITVMDEAEGPRVTVHFDEGQDDGPATQDD